MLIYQNIGHSVVVASMAGLTAAYLGYAAWHWPTFTQGVAPSPGLPTVVFSAFTLRCYYTLLPPAVAATLAGALLLALVAIALSYLRTLRYGLTGVATDETNPLFNLESLVVARYNVPGHAPAAGFEFGGGRLGRRGHRAVLSATQSPAGIAWQGALRRSLPRQPYSFY